MWLPFVSPSLLQVLFDGRLPLLHVRGVSLAMIDKGKLGTGEQAGREAVRIRGRQQEAHTTVASMMAVEERWRLQPCTGMLLSSSMPVATTTLPFPPTHNTLHGCRRATAMNAGLGAQSPRSRALATCATSARTARYATACTAAGMGWRVRALLQQGTRACGHAGLLLTAVCCIGTRAHMPHAPLRPALPSAITPVNRTSGPSP